MADNLFQYAGCAGARLKVVGVGGGGSNAVNSMCTAEAMANVELIVANTDAQALEASPAPIKLQLGARLTEGLGAGADPEVGRNAALEDEAILAETLQSADMVFITAGMGGGTGTGAAPVIAKAARAAGALTVGVVTKPFNFEGKQRRRQAEAGVEALAAEVDSIVVIPNQQLVALSDDCTTLADSFRLADRVLHDAVQGISELITGHGLVNVDFADVRTIMSKRGLALMGTGRASGPDRALRAAEAAVSSPLLDGMSIVGATGVLVNFTGGSDMSLKEINEATSQIEDAAHDSVNLIFGAVIDESMTDEIKITVIATGFEERSSMEAPAATGQRASSTRPAAVLAPAPPAQWAQPPAVTGESTVAERGATVGQRASGVRPPPPALPPLRTPGAHTGQVPAVSPGPRSTRRPDRGRDVGPSHSSVNISAEQLERPAYEVSATQALPIQARSTKARPTQARPTQAPVARPKGTRVVAEAPHGQDFWDDGDESVSATPRAGGSVPQWLSPRRRSR